MGDRPPAPAQVALATRRKRYRGACARFGGPGQPAWTASGSVTGTGLALNRAVTRAGSWCAADL
ncbi:hypothetical protein [Streptomyces goshikiensis]|uniref:hypothetical protein n=1 Tax=Streptomyces goshikiensis TaxID=1942 RepID=UPI00365F3CC5